MQRTLRTQIEYNDAMELLKSKTIAKVSEILNIPYGTVKNWKNGRSSSYEESFGKISELQYSTICDNIRNIDVISFQKILDDSSSLSNILLNFGVIRPKTHYIKLIRDKISSFQYDLSKFELNCKNRNSREVKSQFGVLSDANLFVENSSTCRTVIRRRFIQLAIVEYKCSECPIVDEYNGKPITLQLDHINGVCNDHRLANLRWLCPNCHSQQETSFGRNKRSRK